MALWRPVRPAKHLLAMRAIPRDPQRGRGALRRVRRHLRLGLGRWWGGGIATSGRIWGRLGFGEGGDVVHDAELAALLGGPVRMAIERGTERYERDERVVQRRRHGEGEGRVVEVAKGESIVSACSIEDAMGGKGVVRQRRRRCGACTSRAADVCRHAEWVGRGRATRSRLDSHVDDWRRRRRGVEMRWVSVASALDRLVMQRRWWYCFEDRCRGAQETRRGR